MANVGQQKKTELKKSKILHAAAKLFLTNGYQKTKIQDVAKEAGVGPSTAFSIFGDKDGLMAELVAYVLEGQFKATHKFLSGVTDDKILFYAAETTLQLYIAESSEHIRELYATAYSSPKSSHIIYNTITEKLEDIFREHLPHLAPKDFYELELASGGIMRSFMTVPCDRYFTMERKVRRFLETTFLVYEVPREKINEAVAFVAQFDFPSLAQNTIDHMLGYLESQT